MKRRPEFVLPGETRQQRYDYLMSHMSRQEKLDLGHRRAARIRWLRVYNPDVLPIALRAA